VQGLVADLIDHVLGDAEARVEADIATQVFVCVTVDDHLEGEVDAAVFDVDAPARAMVQGDVDHGEQIGREGGRIGVMNAEVRRDEHAPAEPLEVPPQAVLNLADGPAVLGALRGLRLEVRPELLVEVGVNCVERLRWQPRGLVERRAALEAGGGIPAQGDVAGEPAAHGRHDRGGWGGGKGSGDAQRPRRVRNAFARLPDDHPCRRMLTQMTTWRTK
jgi:hypothetical protein